jgi:putative transcriptional regulator
VLPKALRRLAGCDLAELPWRSRGPELKEALLPGEACGLARFVTLQRGKQLPFPREDGLAAALVLTGVVTDRSGQYERGDIIFDGPDAADVPIAASDGDCVCFVVANPPVKVPGPISRVLHRVIGG